MRGLMRGVEEDLGGRRGLINEGSWGGFRWKERVNERG